MGFTRRLVRHTTPRSVRRAMHPVRTARIAATPRSIRRASFIAYSVTNPLGAAENKLISSAFRGLASSGGSQSQTNFASGDQIISGSGVRAEEGANSADLMESLMSVGRRKFEPIQPLVLVTPQRKDPNIWFRPEWKMRRSELHFWQRKLLSELRVELGDYANKCADEDLAMETQSRNLRQEKIDKSWNLLLDGDSKMIENSLVAAFSDNIAKVQVLKASSDYAVLVLALPSFSVMPEKVAHITPTGRLSARKWTKAEEHEAYSRLAGAHLLATLREGFAFAPTVNRFRVVGVMNGMDSKEGFIFDIDAERNSKNWNDDTYGYQILEDSTLGLLRKGKTREIFFRRPEELRPLPHR